MDSGHGNGSSKNTSAEAESLLDSSSFQPVILSGDFENEKKSSTDSDSAFEGVTPDGTEISKSPHSAASSSSESDSTAADDFPFSPTVFPNSNNNDPQSSPKSKENTKLQRRDVTDVSVAAILSTEKIYGSAGPISQVSDITHSSPFPTLSQTKSPPVQIMERSGGYDPNRIPSSAFISGSSTPMDWSANSNDSLFSLPIGNSLVREQFAGAESLNLQEFIIAEESQKQKELYKSGELSRSNKLQSPELVKISNQVTVLGQTSPLTKEKEDKPKRLDLRNNRVLLTDQPNYKTNQEGYKNKNTIGHSDENRTNNQSSAFPTNKKASKKSCCLCSSNFSWCCCPRWPCSWGCCLCSSNCSWGCCSRRPCWSSEWSCSPSFFCKWPSWSACSFKYSSPDCSCWKNSPSFCCEWPRCSACSFKCKSPDCSRWKNSPSFCCKWPSCATCSFKCKSPDCSCWKNFPSFCCKWPSWSACSFNCKSPDCSCWKNFPSFCCKWPSWSACSFNCKSPDCSCWKNTKKLFCCSSCKSLKDWRRGKWCFCPCCCPCCSSCSYSCC